VVSIELKHDNVLALQNNVRAFGATNVDIHEGDATKVLKWKTDVLYVDPPWGGPEYHKVPKLDIYFGGQRLDKWIELVLKHPNRPAYVILKLPRNYNFMNLRFLPNVMETVFYRVHTFTVVLFQTKIV
jgi:precorrin-6B methylase 2